MSVLLLMGGGGERCIDGTAHIVTPSKDPPIVSIIHSTHELIAFLLLLNSTSTAIGASVHVGGHDIGAAVMDTAFGGSHLGVVERDGGGWRKCCCT